MNEILDEIIAIAERALVVAETEKDVVDKPVTVIDNKKNVFISIGGSFDSIILLCKHHKLDPHLDNLDRKNCHSISGHMNDPSTIQKEAFDKG